MTPKDAASDKVWYVGEKSYVYSLINFGEQPLKYKIVPNFVPNKYIKINFMYRFL